ncbi:hypothetical protein OKW34_006674 [Paraburkholderia youngii]|uniref:hypothetical protein n=1 Tax=Paraburkholderia youngii TaxID=2782701 RepID=UPI003D21EDE0
MPQSVWTPARFDARMAMLYWFRVVDQQTKECHRLFRFYRAVSSLMLHIPVSNRSGGLTHVDGVADRWRLTSKLGPTETASFTRATNIVATRGATRRAPAVRSPSQLFRRAVPVESVGRSLQRPKLPRLAADDGLAIWFARPGDMLPDGTIATPVSTPLGDAQAFDYQPDMPAGVSFEIAKTPNNGEPGTWYTNAGSGQMRLYGDDGKAVVDFDFDHDHGQGIPHAHNWDRGVRGRGLPFSLLP